MSAETSFAACEAAVRAHDPDRFLSALFAPAALRGPLFALYAFNHELARVAESVTQPMLGEIRLQWWRETVEQARAGRPREHDVARALAVAFARHELPFGPFDAMLDARVFDSSGETLENLSALEAYADATSGNLMRLAARVLGGSDAAARAAGTAHALMGVARAIPFHASRRKLFLPLDMLADAGVHSGDVLAGKPGGIGRVIGKLSARARELLAEARALPKPGAALPAFLPAATVPAMAKALARPGFDPFRDVAEVPVYRRQLAMLAATLRGGI
ncbi:MAG TPA: squalene/phytoene synthase family protein [Rhizomicrobium sp.]|nr:squalene/phytoene synthase family protein [Rhizomicrobium sp.]